MDIKPNRPVRVGTKMTRSGKDGDVKLPSVEQYATELQGLTDKANAAGKTEAAKVQPAASESKPAPANKAK